MKNAPASPPRRRWAWFLNAWKKPKKRPEPDSLAPIRTIRPPKGGLAQALDDVNATRPEHVPDDATLLVSWVSLPGENTQRTGHWAKQKAWKDTLKVDSSKEVPLEIDNDTPQTTVHLGGSLVTIASPIGAKSPDPGTFRGLEAGSHSKRGGGRTGPPRSCPR